MRLTAMLDLCKLFKLYMLAFLAIYHARFVLESPASKKLHFNRYFQDPKIGNGLINKGCPLKYSRKMSDLIRK